MGQRQSKRENSTVLKKPNPLNEKARNLPLLCVEAICKFSLTSQLVRLYSNAVPLPGAWAFCVEAVLKKRHPLSLTDHPEPTIFDASGSKVASIRRPEAFCFSPLCELVERASVTVYAGPSTSYFNHKDTQQLYADWGESVLSQMQRITSLTLSEIATGIRSSTKAVGGNRLTARQLLLPNLKHLLQQLESLAVLATADNYHHLPSKALVDCMRKVLSQDTPCLRQLQLPESAFGSLVEFASNDLATRRVLSNLSALSVWQGELSWYVSDRLRPHMLQFISTYCRKLSTLAVFVQGDFRLYLATFRALTRLTSLGLRLSTSDSKRFAYHAGDRINTVVDLRIICQHPSDRSCCLAIASLFPNTKAVAFQYNIWYDVDPLILASEFYEGRDLPHLPQIQKLSCFFPRELCWCPSDRLTQFLASLSLPAAVDLSQTSFRNLATDPGLLTGIYRAMQVNSIKLLLVRGPAHRASLPCLQRHADFHGEDVNILAWKDRDLGDQPGFGYMPNLSLQTDMEIVGVKIAGPLAGEPFRIRVLHQLAKRAHIFEFNSRENK